MKKTIFLLITVLLCPALALASFSDVASSYPYYDAVKYVQTEGIVQGYADGTFKPAAQINRAEFTKIIINSLYPMEKITACTTLAKSLSDVPSADWFYPYVCTAVNEGIINGYPDGTFMPSNPINFAEACKILISAYGISSTPTGGAWWQQYVDAFKSKGTKPASITSPDQLISRGETAEMIYQLRSSVPTWAKGATTTSTTTTATGATEEVKALFEKISKLTKLEDYYPYLSKANLNEIKNLVSMISVEEGDPLANETLDFAKSTIKSSNLPGNLTTIPIISVSDNGAHRKVIVSGTVGGYTLTACMGLVKEDGSWKIDEYLPQQMETMDDKCNDAKTYVGLLNSADLVASRLTYSSEYDFKVYLNGYYIVGIGLGGGVKDAKLPLLKGTNKLRIENNESLKKYIKAGDPMAALVETINGSQLKIESDNKTLIDITQSEENTVKTVEFTY
jgi:hypothetical protein